MTVWALRALGVSLGGRVLCAPNFIILTRGPSSHHQLAHAPRTPARVCLCACLRVRACARVSALRARVPARLSIACALVPGLSSAGGASTCPPVTTWAAWPVCLCPVSVLLSVRVRACLLRLPSSPAFCTGLPSSLLRCCPVLSLLAVLWLCSPPAVVRGGCCWCCPLCFLSLGITPSTVSALTSFLQFASLPSVILLRRLYLNGFRGGYYAVRKACYWMNKQVYRLFRCL